VETGGTFGGMIILKYLYIFTTFEFYRYLRFPSPTRFKRHSLHPKKPASAMATRVSFLHRSTEKTEKGHWLRPSTQRPSSAQFPLKLLPPITTTRTRISHLFNLPRRIKNLRRNRRNRHNRHNTTSRHTTPLFRKRRISRRARSIPPSV